MPAPTPAPTPIPTPTPTPAPRPSTGQISLFDGSLTATSVADGGQGAFVFLDPSTLAGAAVAAATDVASGALHVRVDVSAQPSTEPAQLQVCLVPADTTVVSPPCTDSTRLVVRGSGTVSATFPMQSLASDELIDWTKGLSRLLLVLRDDASRPLDERYTRAADGTPIDLSPYYPMTLRLRVVLVPVGGAFAGWN